MDRGTEAEQFLWVLYLSSQTLSLIPVPEKVPREQLEQEQRLCNTGSDCTYITHSSTLLLEWEAPNYSGPLTPFHSDSLCSAAACLLLIPPRLFSHLSPFGSAVGMNLPARISIVV